MGEGKGVTSPKPCWSALKGSEEEERSRTHKTTSGYKKRKGETNREERKRTVSSPSLSLGALCKYQMEETEEEDHRYSFHLLSFSFPAFSFPPPHFSQGGKRERKTSKVHFEEATVFPLWVYLSILRDTLPLSCSPRHVGN